MSQSMVQVGDEQQVSGSESSAKVQVVNGVNGEGDLGEKDNEAEGKEYVFKPVSVVAATMVIMVNLKKTKTMTDSAIWTWSKSILRVTSAHTRMLTLSRPCRERWMRWNH